MSHKYFSKDEKRKDSTGTTIEKRKIEAAPLSRRSPHSESRLKIIPTFKLDMQEKIDLSHNLIRKMENLNHMKQLKSINLSNNRIVKIENIFGLKRLEQLNLSNNCIQTLPRELSWLKELKVLLLHNNKIATLDNLDNISCMRLTHLTIEGNYVCKLADFKKYMMKNFRWLEQLDKKPIKKQNFQTPFESMVEQPMEQLKTCIRKELAETKENNSTQKREKTEIKNRGFQLMSYREYLKKMSNSKSPPEVSKGSPEEEKTPQQNQETPNDQQNIENNTISPERPNKNLQKILFSERLQSQYAQQLQQLQQKLEKEAQTNKKLTQQLEETKKTSMLKEEQSHSKISSLEQNIKTITVELNQLTQKCQSNEKLMSNLATVQKDIVQKQKNVVQLLKSKLTGDFFQHMIVNQAQTIEQLLKTIQEIQQRYNKQFNYSRVDTKRKGELSRTNNTRYPESTFVVGVQSAESNLLDYSGERISLQSKELNRVSQFNITDTVKESAHFPTLHNGSRDRPAEYFKKSMGFSFKKSGRKAQNVGRDNHSRDNRSRDNHSKENYSRQIAGRQFISRQNRSRNQDCLSHSSHQGSSAKHLQTYTYDQDSNYKHRTDYSISKHNTDYTSVQLVQTDNYKNYLKYYLRNNIVEVLSKDKMKTYRGKMSEQEFKHRKYHSSSLTRIIQKGQLLRA